MPCRVSGVQTELTQKDLLPKGRRSFLLRRAGGFVRSRPKQKNDRFRRTGQICVGWPVLLAHEVVHYRGTVENNDISLLFDFMPSPGKSGIMPYNHKSISLIDLELLEKDI